MQNSGQRRSVFLTIFRRSRTGLNLLIRLMRSLSEWTAEENPETLLKVLVGPPGSGTGQIISAWADRQSWKVIDPPSAQQILAGDAAWLTFLNEINGQGFVVPDLEKIYLRHSTGLRLIRRFLDELWKRKVRCLVGCNSWAWAFLRHAMMADSFFGTPLSLDAFDKRRLDLWFRRQACKGGKKSIVFRQSVTGEVILAVDTDSNAVCPVEDSEKPASDQKSGYLAAIASRSRGIPLVAWAIWRNSLLVSVDDEVMNKVGDEAQRAATVDQGLTIWVRPWEQIGLPDMPPQVGRIDLFILHALLLHGGLDAETLNKTLSLTQAESDKTIIRLQSAGLIKLENSLWRVTLAGYPAVRAYLQNEDYLVDDF